MNDWEKHLARYCDTPWEKGGPGESTLVEEVRQALDEISRLRAIVAKLPKCWRLTDNGDLAQDRPVTPGMEIVFLGQWYRAEPIDNGRILIGRDSSLAAEDCADSIEAGEALTRKKYAANPCCLVCGYTETDARLHSDHHLCSGTIPCVGN